MRFFNPKSVRFKITLYTLICLVTVGLFSNFYLYTFLSRIIAQKADAIDTLYLDTIAAQLDRRFEEVSDLALLCASSNSVTRALRHPSLDTLQAKREALSAQEEMSTYLYSFNLGSYINKLLTFNSHGLMIQATAQNVGVLGDYETLVQSELFASREVAAPFSSLSPALNGDKPCLAGLLPVRQNNREIIGWIYLELDLSIVTDMLEPYATLNPIFVGTQSDEKILLSHWVGDRVRELDLSAAVSGEIVSDANTSYKVEIKPLSNVPLSVYNCTDLSAISVDDRNITYSLVVMFVSVALVSLCSILILSSHITRPIQTLIARIRRISANDFSFDPEIERSKDEIGDIGKVVNEMTLSIEALLRQNKEQNEQQKNIEIALLQSQVNPHFLYNTLDSIHWMAVIQKSPGIANVTRGLTNLLKNIAKGTQDKIMLSEEISLLRDYIDIQSVRYLETFEFRCEVPEDLLRYRIIKLTLQPLVENAIFHGIEPTGRFGTITLSAAEDGDDLLLTVEDNGAGMTPEALQRLFTNVEKRGKGSLNGIGVSNVHTRLQLVYGTRYGLSAESQEGVYTRVSVRIPKEE